MKSYRGTIWTGAGYYTRLITAANYDAAWKLVMDEAHRLSRFGEIYLHQVSLKILASTPNSKDMKRYEGTVINESDTLHKIGE